MERTRHNNFPDTNKLPYTIHRCSNNEGFTQILNSMIRSNELSYSAKGVLSVLLSNKEGWISNISNLTGMTSECERTIKKRVKELQLKGYLKIIRYRDKKTKRVRGLFWAYTDIPNKFNFHKNLAILEKMGCEIAFTQHIDNQPRGKKPNCGTLHPNNTIIKKEENNTKEVAGRRPPIKENVCPNGRTFGTDFSNTEECCDDCKLFRECRRTYININKQTSTEK
jgi:hypothetical protein